MGGGAGGSCLLPPGSGAATGPGRVPAGQLVAIAPVVAALVLAVERYRGRHVCGCLRILFCWVSIRELLPCSSMPNMFH